MHHPYETEPPGECELDEALEESFPASDPLARWSGIDRDPRRSRNGRAGGPDPTP
jgi:hypothetical protein